MTINNYDYFTEKTKREFKKEIEKTQKALDKSKDGEHDIIALAKFYNGFIEKVCKTWPYSERSILFEDSEAMMPMPESVEKQFLIRLFDIKNIDLLEDMGIYECVSDYIDYVC